MTESRHRLWLADRLSLLAVQHLRTSGEHLARGALQSVFLGTMRTQNLLERLSLDRSCQLCQAHVGSLWHRCYKCRASTELRRGQCQDFDLKRYVECYVRAPEPLF